MALHSDPERYALMYRLLWRLVHEPGLRNDPIDADMLHAHQMGQAVRRDIQKMKPTLVFRPHALDGAGSVQIAWYEPTHHILDAVAPWFAKRLVDQPFAIFTPHRSVYWDGDKLHHAPGLAGSAVPATSAAAGWLPSRRRVVAQ